MSLFLLLLYLKANYVIICFVAQQTKLNMTASSSIAYLQLWQGGHPCLHTFCSLAAETCLEMLKVSRTNKTQFKTIHIMCHHSSWSQSNFFLFPASWSWLWLCSLPLLSLTDWWTILGKQEVPLKKIHDSKNAPGTNKRIPFSFICCWDIQFSDLFSGTSCSPCTCTLLSTPDT